MIQESARSGIVQKDKETVALIPEIKFGLMTPEDLEKSLLPPANMKFLFLKLHRPSVSLS